MKKIFRNILMGATAVSMMLACSSESLETVPTQSMSGAGLFANPNAALVPLNGICRTMFTAGWSTTGNTHQCFGITAYNLAAEVMGEDHIMAAQGSGWFWFDCLYNVKGRFSSSTWRSYDLWNAFYTWISNANYIIAAEETMEGVESEKNYVIGQAYAIRGYAYFMVAQWFARTYKGHESEPCGPIYTEPSVAGTEGKPRASVQEVYNQVTSDLTKAVSLLEGTKRKHISHLDYATVLGIQARVALVMEDWNLAKSAAEKAIAASGCEILNVKDFMGVNNSGAKNVMWGSEIISDQAGMYASFFSHMSTDVSYGLNARKQINKLLYAKMGEKDTRRAWWDPNDSGNKTNGYQQKKFDFSDLATWTGDYIWMRVEEMYLIKAEAKCRMGDEAGAIADLMTLMGKRDPDYKCEKTGTELGRTSNEETGSLLEEIVLQRRIELWGEAGRIYDLRRLKQGFRRTAEQGWPEAALLGNRPTDDPESYMWVLTIPQSEFDGNVNMDPDKDQNPTGDTK